MSLCGCLALVAYVPPKATLDDAVAVSVSLVLFYITRIV